MIEVLIALFCIALGFLAGYIWAWNAKILRIPHNDRRTMNLALISLIRSGIDYEDAKRALNGFERSGIIFWSKKRI